MVSKGSSLLNIDQTFLLTFLLFAPSRRAPFLHPVNINISAEMFTCRLCTTCWASRKHICFRGTKFAGLFYLALALFISLLIYLTDVFANSCFTIADQWWELALLSFLECVVIYIVQQDCLYAIYSMLMCTFKHSCRFEDCLSVSPFCSFWGGGHCVLTCVIIYAVSKMKQ